MGYALSFAPDFFYGDASVAPEELPRTTRPTSVYQALRSMAPEDWDLMAREVFGADPEYLDPDAVMVRVLETNTCRNLDPPIEVFIDPDGYHTILVY